jgi:hypothetical protein
MLRKPNSSSIFIDLHPSELNICGGHCLFRAIFNHLELLNSSMTKKGHLYDSGVA